MQPIGDVLWMETLREFLVEYAKELAGQDNTIIRPKASDMLFNQGKNGSVTEDQKDLFELFYFVLRGSIVDWETIQDLNPMKTFINHALIDAVRLEDRFDVLSMPIIWNLYEEIIECIKPHVKAEEHWQGWIYGRYPSQPTMTNGSLFKYLPKEYEGETTGMATERALLAPKITSKGVTIIHSILKLIKSPQISGIVTESGRQLDPSLPYATHQFIQVRTHNLI